MKKINDKIKVLILALILLIISSVIIFVNGKTYIVKIRNLNLNEISNIDEIKLEIQKDYIAKCVDKKVEDGVLKLKFEAISKGKTYVDIYDNDGKIGYMFDLYVHDFNIITFNEYMGDCNGSISIIISITI